MKTAAAPVHEIFCSRQGEGLYCGRRQVFLRFAGCNLDCSYCDEPAARSLPSFMMTPAEAAAEVIRQARRGRARMVSLTGGEPLLRWRFIKALAPALRRAGLALHLETNGTLYRELGEVIGLVDAVAMDVKIPSSGGHRPLWSAHRRFLSVAPGKTFIKAVLTSSSSMSDLRRAADLAAAAGRDIPFFIQPASAGDTMRHGVPVPLPPSARQVREAESYAKSRLERVKVLPQQHPLWGVK
ncbi:MAG: Radical SAM domain-containing protein [Elusimicrobia bacterium]|nr:MAG: Radical SAM domain-containing protein [Elusimicrobiota bacterium]KAF0157534.1 MAG: Radical SAM domain-containing protein [Elusimicrobiota bacterium]